jgi:hypothetical protein
MGEYENTWDVMMDDLRVYLIGYILYIIDCHICQDIFDMIDIMTTICIQRCLAS